MEITDYEDSNEVEKSEILIPEENKAKDILMQSTEDFSRLHEKESENIQETLDWDKSAKKR